MQEEYIKEKKIVEKTEEEKDKELIQSIILTKRELETANINFEYAEKELVDYYSYQIKANQAKLNYLLKKVKMRGIVIQDIREKNNVG